jgi:glutaredoxin
MSVTTLKQPLCPYCAKVPAAKHPEYSCPRIAAVQIDDAGVMVNFVSPEDWAIFLKECGIDAQSD